MTTRYVTIATPKGFERNNFSELYEEFKNHKDSQMEQTDTPQYHREYLGIFEEPNNKIK